MAVFTAVTMAVGSINTLLHGIGLYLLLISDEGSNQTVQHLLITNLASSELLKNIASLSEDSLRLLKQRMNVAALAYFSRVSVGCSYSLDSSAMVFLTADQLLLWVKDIQSFSIDERQHS